MKKEKKDKKTFKKSEVVILVSVTFVVSLLLGFCLGNIKDILSFDFLSISNSTQYQDKYLKNFVKNYNYIIDNYYKKVNKDKLIDSAISGMMESLDDPYSVYMDKEESSSFNISLDGEYKGLGVQIAKDTEKKAMLILYVFKDSPADKAGLKVGDYITELNNKSLADKTPTQFSNAVLNSNKTKFEVTILRDEKEEKITVNKSNVVINSVVSETYERNNKKIGYLYISIFANNTASQFEKELRKLEKNKIDSLIIDVRSNTGGHLVSVEAILEKLLKRNQVTYQIQVGKRTKKYHGMSDSNKKYEIVLLGNGDSASASEILISSLMENYDCKFFGEKTYGKGTVQEMVTMTNGQQYKITTKKWLTPKGNWVNDTKGIKPTDEVKLDKKYNETHKDEDDNQLQAAIKYLESK